MILIATAIFFLSSLVGIYSFHLKYPKRRHLFMRDASTSEGYFRIGDMVKVTKPVQHLSIDGSKFSSENLEGTIIDIWEKCEVDPHCCCAELAFDAPIKVCFQGSMVESYTGSSEWAAQFSTDELDKVSS
eukprot:gene5436-10905_t